MSAMWKLEKDLCRCCHAEGSFKHLSDPCFLLGQEEIYSVMLQDCLDIKIVPMTGPLCDATYTICESCVARLRDASNFKRQVQDCEERFKEMYSKNMIKGFAVKDEPCESDADMKQEFQSVEEDEDDDDAFMKFDDEGDDASSYEEHEEMISVEIEAESSAKGKGKAKAKPKPKPKKAPVKKTKSKEKPIKVETEELTEAAVSGEKKKGEEMEHANKERKAVCEITQNDNGDEIFTCLTCGRTYNAKHRFTQHYKHIHMKLKNKTFPCKICGIQLFPHRRYAHLETAHGRPAPTCNICGRKFTAPHLVLHHQRQTHMGERNHKCDICSKTFFNKAYLKKHQITHSDVRDYACDVCGKKFRWKKNLASHMDMHNDLRRFVCPHCGDAFVQHSSLAWHVTKRHPTNVL
ncbi:zinc finger protein 615-like isoform X10 [Cydia pomonella]|uniref:zinc finger protein 615-like isoform X10 n=1 Tax=Cydia pomonella TaxID=82600 RepID=UPI002ADE94EB|nr:zinc finger protein 615-like isoform X10 [Cydia pomonella]